MKIKNRIIPIFKLVNKTKKRKNNKNVMSFIIETISVIKIDAL